MTIAPPTAIAELRNWPRWVLWRTVERDGKPTKIPFRPNGRPASSTDPETWSTYAEVVRALERGGYDGIGYVFAPDDEYAGIDLDKCVVDGKVTFGARTVIDRLASYTELSPSGTGVHILMRAGINGGRKRTAKTPWGGEFESYDRGRFFTITGKHLSGTPETIESRQAELDAIREELFPPESKATGVAVGIVAPVPATLDDVALEEKIRSSKQGPKFAELFDRGAPEGQGSEADLGLCNILAFWLGPDESRIDAWFRRSALMRDKWDSPRGETTYGGYTIARALEDRTEFYGPKQKPAPLRPKDDDPELSYADHISLIFGITDDPIVDGWRSKRSATARVVFTTRSGRVLDLDNWKKATTSARVLGQEVRMQLEADVNIDGKQLGTLDVLVGKFCNVVEAMTVDQRARELGEQFLQDAIGHVLDWEDQEQRWEAFRALQDRHPGTKARTDGTDIAAESLVLTDRATRKRYVRVQWFLDYVKANAVSSTVAGIMEAIEQPGWWARPNSQSKFKAAPAGKKAIYMRMFEVPAGWDGLDA